MGAARGFFRASDVVEIVEISRRQLQYWAQTDLIRPSARTPGGHGRYTFGDLVALKASKRLIDAGVSVQRIRKSIRALRKMLPTVQRPLSELILVATGDVVLAFRDGTAFDAWQRSTMAEVHPVRPRALSGERAHARTA
jgi:DNA-binding transcriptional MerR regulator